MKVSPHSIMHAVEPAISPAIKPRFDRFVDVDNPKLATASILQQSAALRHNITTAQGNLRIVQHRETLRYARMRSGGTLPVTRRFSTGDYVYHRKSGACTSLDAKTKSNIYCVTELKPSGFIVLKGRCRATISAHVMHCAPCHLPIEENSVDPRLAQPSQGHGCEVCKFPDDKEWTLLCVFVWKGVAIYCLAPPLTEIPRVVGCARSVLVRV